MTEAVSITDFLLARVEEEEAMARAAITDDRGNDSGFADAFDRLTGREMLALHGMRFADAAARMIVWNTPRRVLAECKAKRAVLDLHFECRWAGVPSGCSVCRTLRAIPDTYPCMTVRALAAAYVDHPDYSQEWKI